MTKKALLGTFFLFLLVAGCTGINSRNGEDISNSQTSAPSEIATANTDRTNKLRDRIEQISRSYAQDLGIPYLNINAALTETGPELALFAHRATAAPVVLASHWMAGAAVFLALNSVKGFEVIHSIEIGAILDENDPAGPA